VNRRASSLAALLTLPVAIITGSAQRSGSTDPQTTFRSGVALVHLEVSVLDRNRLPVQHLTAADFTVLEEGRARPVLAFTPVDLPARERPSAPWMTDVASDVATNDFPRAGRLVVIVMDRSIEPVDAPQAVRAAESVVDQLRPGDLAAVVWTVYGVPQNFTADRTRLLDAIHQPNAMVPGTTPDSIACLCGSCTADRLADVTEAIQDVQQRRKILIFIGHRFPTGAGGGCGGLIDSARRRFVRAAGAGNVTVHVIDPRGIETLMPGASVSTAPRYAGAANLRRVAALKDLTEPTGGRLVMRNDAAAALPELMRESGSYYVLGFEPAYTGTDGRFRRIDVKVNVPGATIQARRGYYAPGRPAPRLPRPPPGMPPTLVNALSGLWPKTDLRVAVSAAPLAVAGLAGGATAVLVHVTQDLSPDGPLGDAASDVAVPRPTTASVLVGAFDADGRAFGYDRQTVELTPHRTADRLFEYELVSRLDLPPGKYEIRAAVDDSTIRQTGSAYTYVTMPDFIRDYASLSGLFVEVEPGSAAIWRGPLADLVPVRPTTQRVFARTDRVRAYAQAAQGVTHLVMPGYITTDIVDAENRRVFRQEQRIVPEGNRRTRDLLIDVPVARLTPGDYLLSVELHHGNGSARRDLRFEVK
jgi:VWFA-related protein